MKLAKPIIFVFVLLLIFNGSKTFAQEASDQNKPKTLTELKNSIQKILEETKTPGAGVVLVSGDETILLEGFGKADIENNIDVNENTMFRLGSISKMYVALAILKLQEEGRLNLKDKIRDLIPEIEFNNPWEDKFPIRIENLLEHSTGWSYWHFAELGSDDPKPKTLKEALDFCPKARTSKFIPGTRVQYSNVGTSVAAYIVEKVSGLTFEDYVEKYFFKPMGIENMTFLQSEQYKKSGAKLYDNGIKLKYFNILYRPSAALNGSPKDMVKMIEFFIHRGKVDNNQILSDSSLNRMERSESLPTLSKSELYSRVGLSNSGSYYHGFMYYGHGGSVPGGNADFGYLPQYNMGYSVMINGGEEEVVSRIAGLIKYYQTKDLKQNPIEIDNTTYPITKNPSGFYTIINPPIELYGVLERIKNVHKVWIKDDTLFVKRLMDGGSLAKYIPAGNNEFRSVETKQISLILRNDPLVSYTIGNNLKKISPIHAYMLIFMFFSFFILIASTIIFGLLRTLVYLIGKQKNKTAWWISLWPVFTNSFIFIVLITYSLTVRTRYDSFQILGTVNPISVLFFICGICYALAALWSACYLFRNHREKMSKIFYYHSALAEVMNLIFMLYFISNGLIGNPTWL